MPHILKNKLFIHIISVVTLSAFYILIYKLYIPRSNAFGCFDDCFNYLGGYFLTQGKEIFADFFYNHQPGMAYLSAIIQLISNPQSIPELVLRHRQTIILLSLAFSIFLYFRFGTKIIIVTLLYELTKFYVFGDRFLAEGIVGYLLAYIVGTTALAVRKQTTKLDSIFIPIAVWLVVFLREPFVPIALVGFAAYLFFIRKQSSLLLPLGAFLILTVITVLQFDSKEYYFNLVTMNQNVFLQDALSLPLPLKLLVSLFYPVYVLIAPGDWNLFRMIVSFFSVLLIINLFIYSKTVRNIRIIIVILASLTLINLRPIEIILPYYSTFHIAPWFYLLIFWLCFLVFENYKKSKNIFFVSIAAITLGLGFLSTNTQYFIHEKITTNDEFFTNFSQVMDSGTTIRNLANSTDSLFVDGYDDIIIWEAKLKSPYRYSWYTSFMPNTKRYKDERLTMFENNPPDFYYGLCEIKTTDPVFMIITNNYLQINPKKDKNCILIHKEKIRSISEENWKKIEGTRYIRLKIQDR